MTDYECAYDDLTDAEKKSIRPCKGCDIDTYPSKWKKAKAPWARVRANKNYCTTCESQNKADRKLAAARTKLTPEQARSASALEYWLDTRRRRMAFAY